MKLSGVGSEIGVLQRDCFMLREFRLPANPAIGGVFILRRRSADNFFGGRFFVPRN